MPWSAAASAASVAAKRARMAARVAAGKKWCPKHSDGAGAWLDLADFNANRAAPDLRAAYCRACSARLKRDEYRADPAIAAAAKARGARHRAKAKADRLAAAAAAFDEARTTALDDVVAGRRSIAEVAEYVTQADLRVLAARRIEPIRRQVEAQRARTDALAAWRRGLGPAPDPFCEPENEPDWLTAPRQRRSRKIAGSRIS